MAYLLNATKTTTACLAPIYGQNTPHFSHTVIIIIFFLLSYKHFTQAGPVMQLVMFDVSYIDCTPFKNKENYTADNQFKRNTLHQWIPRDY